MSSKFKKFLRKYRQVTFFAGLFLAGAIFTVFSIILYAQPTVDGVEATAIITEIEKADTGVTADGSTESAYTVYVDYLDDHGFMHQHIVYPYYEDGMAVGNSVNLKYDPNNPGALASDNSFVLNTVFLIIGIIIMLFSVVKILLTIRSQNTKSNNSFIRNIPGTQANNAADNNSKV